MLGSCTAKFSTLVADHLGCAADAGSARSQVEQCLGYGKVHRDTLDLCLERQQVAPRKIELLDDCVAAQSRIEIETEGLRHWLRQTHFWHQWRVAPQPGQPPRAEDSHSA